MRPLVVPLALGAGAAFAGCGTATSDRDVSRVVERFQSALAAITGTTDFNTQRLSSHQPPISWLDYVGNADFWERTLQNWQPEFLAVGSMAILAVYLRQRGSPESKPVGAPHDATGVEG